MSFLQPLGFLGLISIPIIVIIYLIKSKYVPKTVSSTFIWKRSLKYVKRKIPINFIMSLLLVLQILVALAATLAITKPVIKPPSSGETIVIIDASASMNTTDGESKMTRFEEAKEKIYERADGVNDNSRMSIIVAEQGAVVYCNKNEEGANVPFNKKEDVYEALERISCTNGESNIDAALLEAESFLASNAGAKVVIYTDKQHVIERNSRDIIEVVSCARENDSNAGIVSMKDSTAAGQYRFDAVIRNFGKQSDFTVSLYYHDGLSERFVESKKISMADEEELEVIFTPVQDFQAANGRNQQVIWISNGFKSYKYARIEINTEDGLAVDNSYTLFSEKQEDPKILFVSSNIAINNGQVDPSQVSMLRSALNALGYNISSADMYKSPDLVPDSKLKGYDLYIYEGVMPDIVPTDGSVWFLNVPIDKNPTGTDIKFSGYTESLTSNGYSVVETKFDAEDEISLILKNNVNFKEPIKLTLNGVSMEIPASLSAYRTMTDPLPDNFTAVYSVNGSPVIMAGKVGTVKTIVTAFDFVNSSLPIFVSDFPVLINNMVEYSMSAPLPNRTSEIGQDLIFSVPAGASEVNYYSQSNEEDAPLVLEAQWQSTDKNVPEIKLSKLGTYQMEVIYKENGIETGRETYTLTTHVPEGEVSIFSIGDSLDVEIPDYAIEQTFNIDILPWVLLVLVVLLIVEWGVYYRDEH
ncbi:MAG: BatA and WFA domain-containing protein [Clostridia bacterium]|nr:BatA and WFA domain-containing protein [Clostridia bacterium]